MAAARGPAREYGRTVSDVDRGDEAPAAPAQDPPSAEVEPAPPSTAAASSAPSPVVPVAPAAPGAPAVTGPADLRASDADRERYVEVLRESYAEGRLQADEYEERMDAAYRARTYAELAPLLQDLPVPPGAVPSPPLPAARPVADVGVAGAATVPVLPGGVVGRNSVVAVFGGARAGGRERCPRR